MKYKIPISIIMPCYNSAAYISQAIHSLLGQSYEHFELIIINDGSSDGTESEIKKFEDHRIKYIKFYQNKGNYVARNYGMSIAQGKYMCMMDSDDIALPNRLEIQLNHLEKHPSIGCVGGLSIKTGIDDTFIGLIHRPLSHSLIKVSLLKDNYITQPTIMLRSHLVKKHRLFFNEKYIYASDYDYVVRASRLFTVQNLNKVLIQYRSHPNQISSSKQIKQEIFADEIRIQQLKLFNIPIDQNDIRLHLKLMKGKYFSSQELKTCEDWLNKLYEANHNEKLYNDKYLYELFKNLLGLAARNNSLGDGNISNREMVRLD